MKLKPIINSLLENDLYKFSMGQCIFHQFADYSTTWAFKNRDWKTTGRYTPEMVEEIREQVQHYCSLRFTEDELFYLKTIPWIKSSYVDFLRFWHPRQEEIQIEETDENDCGIKIRTRGSWLNTSMYEVPLLAIVNEVQMRLRSDYEANKQCAISVADDTLYEAAHEPIGTFSEFGMRRRFTSDIQDWVVGRLAGTPGFVGTSNVFLANKYGVKPVGTMAHEFAMCVGQGTPGWNPAFSNKFMMSSWVKEYGVENGIALTDTIGLNCFLLDFDKAYATLFSGVRHDSGDPVEWGNRMIFHYKTLGIDPMTKTLLFSDGLDFDRARMLNKEFEGKAKVAFGIGTFLANPSPVKPNIVMKVVECNGGPVAKISDSPGKSMCEDNEYVEYLKRAIDWRVAHGR